MAWPSKVSKSVSQKDAAKQGLRRVLQAVVYGLKAYFPDTFEAELRSWGFWQESYQAARAVCQSLDVARSDASRPRAFRKWL